MTNREIENAFPNLAGSGYEITSQSSDDYNCIAWAVGITGRRWDCDSPRSYWPPSLPRNQEVATLIRLFAGQGYTVCDDDAKEPGYEKIAIYAIAGTFFHVAKQLSDGRWSSNLGSREDITHPTSATLAGGIYGNVHCIMRRPIP